MTWRQHLRDLVLAGGALAAAACSAVPGGGGPPGGTFCCNANSDPCCESNYCGAAVSDACACKQKGGDWQNPAADGGFACTFPSDAGPAEAGPIEAAPGDAGPGDADADIDAHI